MREGREARGGQRKPVGVLAGPREESGVPLKVSKGTGVDSFRQGKACLIINTYWPWRGWRGQEQREQMGNCCGVPGGWVEGQGQGSGGRKGPILRELKLLGSNLRIGITLAQGSRRPREGPWRKRAGAGSERFLG